jgi:hypothetical protein
MFNDGGPAFPQLNIELIADNMAVQNVSGGASLWDMYAAAALQGITAGDQDYHPCESKDEAEIEKERNEYAATIARSSARYADAMIAEREKRRANIAST